MYKYFYLNSFNFLMFEYTKKITYQNIDFRDIDPQQRKENYK